MKALELGAQASKQKGIEVWLNNTFESSTGLTPEFATFARDFKKALLANVSDKFELVSWNRNHFGVSGFLKNKDNDNLVYFSISDVRFFPGDWYEHILIRTAKHDKDYTGGSNCYATFVNLKQSALKLTS